jgi:hypothetical protein
MTEEFIIEIKGGQTAKAMLKELNTEMGRMVLAGQDSGAKFDELTKKIGKLKDSIGDAADRAKALGTAGGGIKAIGTAVGVAASGFTALQGAITLAGGSAQTFEKTMVKLQAAMALSQGISQLAEMKDAFTNLKSVAVSAFGSVKSALIATGIGAFVVVLGTVVAYWDDITEAVLGYVQVSKAAAAGQKTLNEALVKGEESAQAELVSLKLLYDRSQNLSLSMKERKQSVDALQKQWPTSFGNLKDEIILTGQAKTQYDRLTESILANAKSRAIEESVFEIYKKNTKKRLELQKNANDAEKYAEDNKGKEIIFKKLEHNDVVTKMTAKEADAQRKAVAENEKKKLKDFKAAEDAEAGVLAKGAEVQNKIISENQEKTIPNIIKKAGKTRLEIEKKKFDEWKKLQDKALDEELETEENAYAAKIRLAKENGESTTFLEKQLLTNKEGIIETYNNKAAAAVKTANKVIVSEYQGHKDEIQEKYDENYKSLLDKNSEFKIEQKSIIEKADDDIILTQEQQYAKEDEALDKKYADALLAAKNFYTDSDELAAANDKIMSDKATERKQIDDKRLSDRIGAILDGAKKETQIAINQAEKEKKIDEEKLAGKLAIIEKVRQRIIQGLELITGFVEAAEATQTARIKDNDKLRQQVYEREINAAAGNADKIAEINAKKEQDDRESAIKLDKIKKDSFEKQKKLQIAATIVNTIASGVSTYMSLAETGPWGVVAGVIAAAAAVAAGYVQVKKIQATRYEGSSDMGGSGGGSSSKFAKGGRLEGRKHSEGGIATQFGELEGGEFVVNRQATNSFLPMLEKINSMGSGSGQQNNMSTTAESSQRPQPQIIKTYVVASDMTSQQEADKKIANIARL